MTVWMFQSTLPAWGATWSDGLFVVEDVSFNPRSPHGERLGLLVYRLSFRSGFNPRSPHGERQNSRRRTISFSSVSIHAPRMGSDFIDKP